MAAGASWRERSADPAVRQALEAHGFSLVLARLLAARGLTPDDLDDFFDPSISRLASAAELPGVMAAVDVILPFVASRRKIVVFGDYDADGVCASAILVRTIRRLGGVAEAFIPKRLEEGYGMTDASLARLFSEHPDMALVVTVDNGITAQREVAMLKERGIAVVVTDHHLPGPELPEPDALVDPRVASSPGCEGLCGAGVAFFLAAALTKESVARGMYSGGKFAGPLLVLAGLATVADLMPLVGQNRILVRQSLAAFRAYAPIGLREMFDRASKRLAPIVSRDFGFLLAPRINAAGRMDAVRAAYELLMTDDREEARRLAVDMEGLNGLRKTKEQHMKDAVDEQVKSYDGLSAVVARGMAESADNPDGWHSGVAGIVAARVMERAQIPVAVVVGDHGSARAPEGYNVHDALTAASAALVRFGGHAAAGGFTIKPGRYDDFRRLFAEACAAQRAATPEAAAIAFDCWLEPADLDMGLYDDICRLEPFGEGNPEPVFGIQNVAFSDIRPIGVDGRHVTFSFANRSIPRAVWWNHGHDADELRAHASARFDLLFTLHASDFGVDSPALELRIVAVRPH